MVQHYGEQVDNLIFLIKNINHKNSSYFASFFSVFMLFYQFFNIQNQEKNRQTGIILVLFYFFFKCFARCELSGNTGIKILELFKVFLLSSQVNDSLTFCILAFVYLFFKRFVFHIICRCRILSFLFIIINFLILQYTT